MKPTMKSSFLKINSSDLDDFEKSMNHVMKNEHGFKKKITLPEDFGKFLIESNGGIPFPYYFTGDLGNISLYEAFLYGYYPDYESSVNLFHVWDSRIDLIEDFDGEMVIPLASLGSWEDLVLILTGPEKGYVYMIWNDSIEAIASSFTKFINNVDYGPTQDGSEPDYFYFQTASERCVHSNNCQPLLKYLAKYDFDDEELKDMLWVAIDTGCLIAIENLYERKPSLPQNWNLGHAKNIDIAKYMLKQGLHVNSPGANNIRPLEVLVRAGKLDIVKYLVEQHNADLHIVSLRTNQNLLQIAEDDKQKIEDEWPYNQSENRQALEKIISYLRSQGLNNGIENKKRST